MRKIHVTQQFFKASGLWDRFFQKKKHIFRYGLGECVYRISGLYLFSMGPKGAVQTDKQSHRHTFYIHKK